MNNNAAASQLETIGFIESMLSDLRQMGQSIDARFLVYLIELAMIEASDIKTGKQPCDRNRRKKTPPKDKLSPDALSRHYMSGALD